VRAFKRDSIPKEQIEKILEAGRWAPSGINSQPWEFIVVNKKDLRKKIAKIFIKALQSDKKADPTFPFADRSYMMDVPAFIIVLGDPRYIEAYPKFHPRGIIFIQSIAACIQNMLLATASLNLGSVWVTITKDVESQLKDLLGVPQELRIINLLPIGLSSSKPAKGQRKSLNELVHYEVYDQNRFIQKEKVLKLISLIKRARAHW